VRDTLAGVNFGLGDPYIFKDFRPIEQRFVLAGIHEDGRTPAMLGQNYWAFRLLNLPDYSGEVRAKVSKRADVLSRANT
jgi:hypothetical protein